MTANETSPAPQELHVPHGFLSWVAVLVHKHRARLLVYARRRGLNAQDALDAVQDCFVAFLRLPEARAITDVSDDSVKMLTVILRHNIQNRRRKQFRRARAQLLLEAGEAALDTTTSEDLIAHAEDFGRAHGCILRMARLQRRVVMLSLLDEQPREAVAKLLGISDGYVRVLLHRARDHIRKCTFEYDDDAPPKDG